ncbi:MAG: DUF58 domain-containing protein [Myxococcota bacterium]
MARFAFQNERPEQHEAALPLPAELARAARILTIRSRREATGVFAGSYATAFRGGGMEFHESRPYVPGDDVRSIDWNAMARTGEPYVKRFREERDQLLLLGLDVSASMLFGSDGRSKIATAMESVALLAAVAGRAGDRVGLLAFDDQVRAALEARRGATHTWCVIRSAARTAGAASGGTRLDAAIDGLLALGRQRGVVVLLSDFGQLGWTKDPASGGVITARLATLAQRHDLVSIVLHDPADEILPRAGLVRLADPERPGSRRVVNTGSARVRRRYERAWQARRNELERSLRAAGSDVLWMRTDRAPLKILLHFFEQRRRGRPIGERSRARQSPPQAGAQ